MVLEVAIMASNERHTRSVDRDAKRLTGDGAYGGAPTRTEGTRTPWAYGAGGALAAIVIALLLIPLGGAHSATGLLLGAHPTPALSSKVVDSNFTGNITFTSVSVVNNVTYLTATTYRLVTGNMSGALLAYEWGAVQANGSMWVRGIGTFVGSILGGSPGLVHLAWYATGIYGGTLNGFVHVGHGQQGLAGVHGGGTATATFTGPTTFDGGYDFRLVVP
jgi:hypothetical protein